MTKRKLSCGHPGCTYATDRKGNLTRHKRTHSGETPFKCNHPGCTYASKDNCALTVHKRAHSGETPYKCDHLGCTYASASSSNLTVHKRTHSGETPFKCNHPGCTYASASSGHLKSHKRIHSGEKPFKCDHPGCIYASADNGALRVHMRTHTGENPYKCDHPDCTYAGLTNGRLTAHKRTHNGETPYKCDHPGCTYAAAESGTLTLHKRTHSGEKPFKCDHPECTYAASRSCNLASHKQSMHTPEGMQRRKRKEESLAKALTCAGIDYKREHRVVFTCFGQTWAFCDFLLIMKGRVIVIECDEFQHTFSNYTTSCEIRRMMDIVAALKLEGCTLPVSIIRWNPDSFTVDGQIQKMTMKKKQERLVHLLQQTDNVFQKSFEVLYMFYDTSNSKPNIWNDSAFDGFRQFCITTE